MDSERPLRSARPVGGGRGAQRGGAGAGRGAHRRPRPRRAGGHLAPPAAAPDWLQGGGRNWGSAPRRTTPPLPQHTCRVTSFPDPLATAHAPPAQEKERPPGTEPRSSRSRSAPSSIPGGRGRARGLREGAIQRGCTGMLPGRPAAAIRLPAPSSGRSPRGGWTRAAWASRSATGVAWHGPAGGWSPVRPRLAHGHPLAGGWGPERPAWGRSEAAAGGGGGGGVDSAAAAAAGLGTTFYIWPLVWGPRGRRGPRRETLGRGSVASGSRHRREGADPARPRRTMHLGGQAPAEGLQLNVPAPSDSLPPSRTEPQKPSLPSWPAPGAPLPPPPTPPTPRLFRIGEGGGGVGEGWC